MPFLSSADFFQINFFKEIFHEHYQSVKLFGSRSGPTFWVQTVCQGSQQTTKVAASKGRVINFEGPYICSLFFLSTAS